MSYLDKPSVQVWIFVVSIFVLTHYLNGSIALQDLLTEQAIKWTH